MIPLPDYEGKTVAVVGLGRTGEAAAMALQQSGARLIAWDDNDANRAAFVAKLEGRVAMESPESWDWAHLDAMVLSPGIPLTHPAPHPAVFSARQHRVPIVSDIELLLQSQSEVSAIGITGTNGKSTTTSLIGHILQQAGRSCEVGGNIGRAALSMQPLEAGGVYVLEMSSYQLDLLQQSHFHIALLLNISEDHLDRHGGMEGYIAAKKHIFDRQSSADVAIVGIDDAYSEALCRELIAGGKQTVIPISTTQEVTFGIRAKDGVLHCKLGTHEAEVDLQAIKTLQGEHNWQNAAAAYAATYAYGLDHEHICDGLASFPGLAHRMEWVGDIDGVQFVNDSKATNADAAEKALKAYEHIYWILGGVAKEGGIVKLAQYFPRIAHAYLIGDATDAFADTLKRGEVEHSKCGTLAVAFDKAASDALKDEKKGVVLLAPACASFDQFTNFEERGAMFKSLVEEFKQREQRHAV